MDIAKTFELLSKGETLRSAKYEENKFKLIDGKIYFQLYDSPWKLSVLNINEFIEIDLQPIEKEKPVSKAEFLDVLVRIKEDNPNNKELHSFIKRIEKAGICD